MYETPLSEFGLTSTMLAKLEKMNLRTARDVLLNFPIRYDDKTRLYPLKDASLGDRILIQGVIQQSAPLRFGRQGWRLVIQQGLLNVQAIFFKVFPNQSKSWQVGAAVRIFGTLTQQKNHWAFVHPQVQVINPDSPPALPVTMEAVYRLPTGFPANRYYSLVQKVLQALKPSLHKIQLPGVSSRYQGLAAWSLVHAPTADIAMSELIDRAHEAWHQLAIQECLAYRVVIAQLDAPEREPASSEPPKIQYTNELKQKLIQALPFTLTGAQQRVLSEIQADFHGPVVMSRLLQGDVGSGKTIVGLLAACECLTQGQQVAIMAPTEVLAKQWLSVCQSYLSPHDITVMGLFGKQTAKEKKAIGQKLAHGDAQVVIGTHALFQSSVEFSKLVMVIIDEQHRFGVAQRLALKEKGMHVHQLIMTATPIPRTLCMVMCAHMPTSILDEKPPNRQPIQTVALPSSKVEGLRDRLTHILDNKQQVYWVCPLIEDSDKLPDLTNVTTRFEWLNQHFKDRVALVHGRLSSEEKQAAMDAFKSGEKPLLVATTVIEVGVDVPEAVCMIIEDSQRFGLAQLHQLRGRVGRGDKPSYCCLIYQEPLSHMAKQRLAAMQSSEDGFYLSEVDLSLRGEGEILGVKQSGSADFKVFLYARDKDWITPWLEQYANKINKDVLDQVVACWVGADRDYQTV